LHGDGGGKVLANKRPVIGRAAVTQFVVAVTRTLPPDAILEEIELNGAFAVANPNKLDAVPSAH
jgi:hypothetical protein